MLLNIVELRQSLVLIVLLYYYWLKCLLRRRKTATKYRMINTWDGSLIVNNNDYITSNYMYIRDLLQNHTFHVPNVFFRMFWDWLIESCKCKEMMIKKNWTWTSSIRSFIPQWDVSLRLLTIIRSMVRWLYRQLKILQNNCLFHMHTSSHHHCDGIFKVKHIFFKFVCPIRTDRTILWFANHSPVKLC